MQNVLEAYSNPIEVAKQAHGSFKIDGITKTGMPIRIITNETGEVIKSFFPTL